MITNGFLSVVKSIYNQKENKPRASAPTLAPWKAAGAAPDEEADEEAEEADEEDVDDSIPWVTVLV